MMPDLDVDFVRQHFPAYQGDTLVKGHFFDSAAGSYPCNETIESLQDFYLFHKVQPGNPFNISEVGMLKMETSKKRWAEALGVNTNEVGFGPSTTQNTYVLANAFREILKPLDEVIVTNQDHEANTGSIRRACTASGAVVKEWKVDPQTGMLDIDALSVLISDSTRLVCVPHSSNVSGQKNEIKKVCDLAHAVNAWVLVDGVSYAPHDIPNVDALGADIYVFSLYKVFSVHQGIMVLRDAVMKALPKQGHYFKESLDVGDLFVPAGPDHAQIAAADGALDYIETLSAHHGGPVNDLRLACDYVSDLWRKHEVALVKPLLDFLATNQNVRVIGSMVADKNRCPLVSFAPANDSPEDLVHILCDQDILLSWGHFYAPRLLEAMNIDSSLGVVRVSMAHYNNLDDVNALIEKLEGLL